MIDEGYIKYQCHWIKDNNAVTEADIFELNQWRDRLYKLGLIGIYNNGIGFGNSSIRYQQSSEFMITGTQTGGLSTLTKDDYTKVIDFNIGENSLTCVGNIKASSESLTHAAVYKANPDVNAVIHVHNYSLWQKLMYQVPTTNPNCAYGTPEMAQEIMRLCQEEALKTQKILVMSGHEEGIITFGINLEEAGKILLKYYDLIN